jgi:glutamate racemase
MRATDTVDRPIVIFDSGIGGLPYLSAARSILPNEDFIYLADRAGFPYGSKTREEVKTLVLGLVSRLVEAYDPKALVIACNTASQAALDAARRANPGLSIIGTVPAVKPAAERSRSGVIGVMATAGAVEDPYLDTLVARHAKGLDVLREGAQDLVGFVERRSAYADARERREAVAPCVGRLVAGGADVIVLACTHFLHLRDDIAAVAGPSVEVIDSRAGVVKRLKQVLAERGLLAKRPADGGEASVSKLRSGVEKSLFLLTGEEPFEEEYGLLADSFGLARPTALPGNSVAWTG